MSIYNKEIPSNLNQCLESLASQTIPAIEIIIVKDGTLTPELEETLAFWKTKLPLKIVGYTQNHGLAYALNYGLGFVSCELVARMDSDDICLPDRFEKQLAFFENNGSVVAVGSDLLEFYEEK
jgi:glycosyltransferase involved in cell wall biosynthesis